MRCSATHSLHWLHHCWVDTGGNDASLQLVQKGTKQIRLRTLAIVIVVQGDGEGWTREEG